MELINHHSDRVERATGVGRPCPRGPWATLPGQPWTLGMQITRTDRPIEFAPDFPGYLEGAVLAAERAVEALLAQDPARSGLARQPRQVR